MKPLILLLFFCGTLGPISVLSQEVPNDDAEGLQSPTVDSPHHVQRRVIVNPFIGDPTIRFFLRVLMAPFSIFGPESKAHQHESKLSAGLNRNSTYQKTENSKIVEKMNKTDKSDAIFGKVEPKPKRSNEFGTAHSQHFRFDPFSFVFHRPVAERSGPVIDTEMRETADVNSTEKKFGNHGTLKSAGSTTQEKNITNMNFFSRRYAFIWSIEWRSLVMHVIVVVLFTLIITLVLLFCQTVFSKHVKKVQLHPDGKFVTKQEDKDMC